MKKKKVKNKLIKKNLKHIKMNENPFNNQSQQQQQKTVKLIT